MKFLVHPLISHFPVALWLTSFLFDILFAKTRERFFATASAYLVGVGLLSAAVAIALGFADLIPLVAGGVGQAFVNLHKVHSTLAYTSTATYAMIFFARWRWRTMPPALYLGMAVIGAILISATGWFGGAIRQVM